MKSIEERLDNLEDRNSRVEADKGWETQRRASDDYFSAHVWGNRPIFNND